MVNIDKIKETYPLHWLVWNNDYNELDRLLSTNQHDKEKHDNRGRSPLMLAVTLGYKESVEVLLNHEANVYTENTQGWSVVQEATGTGNPEILQMVLARRDYQRYCNRIDGIPELLHKLKQAPDFYVEMKWEFTSWVGFLVPLASRMCPSDTYKVYKQGSNVRIDTTLLGFDHANWQRGNLSYVFKGQKDVPSAPVTIRCDRSYVFRMVGDTPDDGATMMEVDHETRKVYVEHMKLIDDDNVQLMAPSEEGIMARLTNPIVTTYVDTDKISFERNKAGIWGWRSDKSEVVNGHECKVFSASNVELISKTRLEHLSEADKVRSHAPRTPLQSFLGIAEQQQEENGGATCSEEFINVGNPSNITPEEYFDPEVDLNGRDIGRPKEVTTKIQKFRATLWLSEEYPLKVPHVKRIQEGPRTTCIVDDICFEAPAGYVKLGALDRTQFSIEEEDDLLQFAIQQSLLEAGSERDEVDIWEALRAQKPSRPTTPNMLPEEERQLQSSRSNVLEDQRDHDLIPDTAEQLKLALRLSEQQQLEDEQRRLLEEETFRQVLELSLTEK
ncbi:Similar to Ankrd13d: Ankyrin repeat domain-containing protein 13D (Mus musculus) [Cotesia congregata]|uniref:Similar to Ankrd13d: Ankyrin repeat domain-containing protein 13D (Mus musculus) n=1 Tax=Cotesia congregata TaxID=51543 RepID=A0A8J2HAN6_COTCN|nr:Similar to Ankrd13d: Ankyrin repeat domain-containing protein 13D (Mus musculus) [Cotesia congregata]